MMMADTTMTNKSSSSRIVSDDVDLEASLMLEFNKRLQTCLSSEAVHANDDDVQMNGDGCRRKMAPSSSSDDDEFMRIERECDAISPPPPDAVRSSSSSVKERMLLSAADSTSCLLFTQTVTSPQLTPTDDERVDFLRSFETTTTDGDGDGQLSPDLLRDVPPPTTPSDDSTHASSQMTTTTCVETTLTDGATTDVMQQQSNMAAASATKKKSKKKTRSHHEKENISVPIHEMRFYNVNVKSLCRSFGDLTKLAEDASMLDDESRTVSLTDIRNVGRRVIDADATRGRCRHNNNNNVENVFTGVSVRALKSSFSKFDALQKKSNVLHVRSTDSTKASEKFTHQASEGSTCKACAKTVFQMEQMKAERCIWHKNCFRCSECNKPLTVDTYESHEGALFCKPHFKALFAPKAVEEADDDDAHEKPRKHELIVRENQPEELPPDVVRASDKPDLGLAELHALNVKERFQVFEQHQQQQEEHVERTAVNVKRSPSILSKLARFHAKGMDIGVADESLNTIPIEPSSSSSEDEAANNDIDDVDLVRAKRAQREKPFHFAGMSDVKNKWEHGGEANGRDERREERKQEIQNIRNRLFMGKQGKMKEMYQQAVMEAESGGHVKRAESIEVTDTRSIKERFERGEVVGIVAMDVADADEILMFESAISKKSRSIFQELDANASKVPTTTMTTTKKMSPHNRQVPPPPQDGNAVVKATQPVEDVHVQTEDIQQRFKFFETYRAPEHERKRFRITPPRDGQVKVDDSPDREVLRAVEHSVEDSAVAVQTQTAQKMLNKFRQMEEDLSRQPLPLGPKPLKRFTPPPEPLQSDVDSDEEDYDEEEEEVEEEQQQHPPTDGDLIEAQKAARAKQLRAKFEQWEAANKQQHNNNNGGVNIADELLGDEQSQIESTKSLRARFESMKSTSSETTPRVARLKVNRFVNNNEGNNSSSGSSNTFDVCQDCKKRVYPLEKVSVHSAIYHKMCFKCMECNTILRMDSYTYNQGLLYCTPHFKRLFIAKGNYDTAFGLEQHKEKWNTTMA